MTSTSLSGSSVPTISASSWKCWRYRPACGASYRNAGPAVHAFHGTGGSSAKARMMPAVNSGRTATRRPPLSSKSYISLRTMSVESPTRRKTSRCSISGVMTSPNPARSACGERGDQAGPTLRLRRQDVGHATRGLELGHEGPG